MTLLLTSLASLTLAYAAMTALCLGMPRYWRQCVPTPLFPHRQRALRGLGWLLLAVASGPGGHAWGGPIGLALWPGALATAGMTLVCVLAYRPRWIPRLGLGSVCTGLLASGWLLIKG